MQFIINAYDYTDKDALERRMAVRPRHLENIKKVMENDRVICAGGLMDGNGAMKGSFLVMEFKDRAGLDAYLASEPYVTEGVWEKVEVEPCNAVIVNNEKVGR